MAHVTQLLVGSSSASGSAPLSTVDGWSPATGSVSLITDGQLVVLVDTAGPANWQELEAALHARGGVCASAVTHVVCTHGHIDHIGNLSHFAHAQQLLDSDWALPMHNLYRAVDWTTPQMLNDNITLERRVGHTSHDIVVFVRTDDEKRVCVAVRVNGANSSGDIFEHRDDASDWADGRAPDNSWQPSVQRASREYITQNCHSIIPGHGAMFAVQ